MKAIQSAIVKNPCLCTQGVVPFKHQAFSTHPMASEAMFCHYSMLYVMHMQDRYSKIMPQNSQQQPYVALVQNKS